MQKKSVGPQIRKLMIDEIFQTTMNKIERNARKSFKEVVSNILRNRKSPNYKSIVGEMPKNFQKLGYRMSVKVHYLSSNLDFFSANLGSMSEEQDERFHQNFLKMESRYQ